MIIQHFETDMAEPTLGQIVAAIHEKRKEQNRYEELSALYDSYASSSDETYKNGVDRILVDRAFFPIAEYITTIRSSYLLSEEPKYESVDTDDETTSQGIGRLLEIYRRQSIEDVDYALRQTAGRYGSAYEYIFYDGKTIKSKPMPYIQTLVVFSDDLARKSLYGVTWTQFGEMYTVYVATDTRIKTYETRSLDVAGSYMLTDDQPHYFGKVPITQYRNNDDERGDVDGVRSLILLYRDLITDMRYDVRRTVDALLVMLNTRLKGATVEEKAEIRNAIRRLGILELNGDPDSDPAGVYKPDVKTLSNPLNLATVQAFADKVWSAIFRLSGVPDPMQSEFYTALSGVALEMQVFMGLQPYSRQAESKFKFALKRRVKLYATLLKVKGELPPKFAYENVKITLDKKLARNDLETAQIIGVLDGRGIVTKQTLAAQLSFVKDPEQEVRAAAAEQSSQNTDALLQQLGVAGGGGSA